MNYNYFDNDMVTKFFKSSSNFSSYLIKYNLEEIIKQIQVPTLIIHGDYDVIPNESIIKMKNLFPNSEVHIINECGHFVHLEKPEIYFSIINEFLKK